MPARAPRGGALHSFATIIDPELITNKSLKSMVFSVNCFTVIGAFCEFVYMTLRNPLQTHAKMQGGLLRMRVVEWRA
jgi:hypothetical protein